MGRRLRRPRRPLDPDRAAGAPAIGGLEGDRPRSARGYNTPRNVAALPRALDPGSDSRLRPRQRIRPAGASRGATRPRSRCSRPARSRPSRRCSSCCFYSPPLVGFLALVAAAGVGDLVLVRGSRGVPSLRPPDVRCWPSCLPFANLLWVRVIQLVLRGGLRATASSAGYLPQVESRTSAHLVRRAPGASVLWPLRTVIRSAPLMAWVLRRLGATVGRNLQCAHDVEFFGPLDLLVDRGRCRDPDRCLSRPRRSWVGQELHVGPVHLDRGCKLGMRAGVANHVTVGRGSWITPLTPVLADVGPEEIWEGAPARCVGRCTELARTATAASPRALPGGCSRRSTSSAGGPGVLAAGPAQQPRSPGGRPVTSSTPAEPDGRTQSANTSSSRRRRSSSGTSGSTPSSPAG